MAYRIRYVRNFRRGVSILLQLLFVLAIFMFKSSLVLLNTITTDLQVEKEKTHNTILSTADAPNYEHHHHSHHHHHHDYQQDDGNYYWGPPQQIIPLEPTKTTTTFHNNANNNNNEQDHHGSLHHAILLNQVNSQARATVAITKRMTTTTRNAQKIINPNNPNAVDPALQPAAVGGRNSSSSSSSSVTLPIRTGSTTATSFTTNHDRMVFWTSSSSSPPPSLLLHAAEYGPPDRKMIPVSPTRNKMDILNLDGEKKRRKATKPDYGGIDIEQSFSSTRRRSRSHSRDNHNHDDNDNDTEANDDDDDDNEISRMELSYEEYREEFLNDIEEQADRSETSRTKYDHIEEIQDADLSIEHCQKVNWYDDMYPTCNGMHEQTTERRLPSTTSSSSTITTTILPPSSSQNRTMMEYFDYMESLQDYDVSYISQGTYRASYRYQRIGKEDEDEKDLVLKQSILLYETSAKSIDRVRREALVMEHLSASPYILDIYGYCGTSVWVESMVSDLFSVVLEPEDEEDGVNNWTATYKLQLALEMAQGLADLHGHVDGQLVHTDIHLTQWLIAKQEPKSNQQQEQEQQIENGGDQDSESSLSISSSSSSRPSLGVGSVKLNDFNLIKISTWNTTTQEYCLESTQYNNGRYKSPEEYKAGMLQDAKVDVYSLGNNIYGLLTGLRPFNDVRHYQRIQNLIKMGKRPQFEPQPQQQVETKSAMIEKELRTIVEQCWEHNREKRPDIFMVVQSLKDIMKRYT